jgi:hypothetical protein
MVILCFAFGLLAILSNGWAAKAAAITTYHYDNFRTGWNQRETVLRSANVGDLQLRTIVFLDEHIDAQPLLVPAVTR